MSLHRPPVPMPTAGSFIVPLFPAAEYEPDGCFVQAEGFPEPVEQEAFIGKMDTARVIAKQNEHWRAGPGLCPVKKLEPPASNDRRLVCADSILDPPVEYAC